MEVLGAVVSVLAVIVAVVALRSDARDRRVMAKPLLSFYRHADETTKTVELEMRSVGLGPAIVCGYMLQFDGRELPRGGAGAVQNLATTLQATLGTPHIVDRISAGSVLGVGERLSVLRFIYQPLPGTQLDLRDLAARFDVQVEYRSIFDDKVYKASSKDAPW